MHHIMAFDVGTSGTKAVVTTLEGDVVAADVEAHAIARPRHGWVEQDPDDWWRAVGVASRHVLAAADVTPADIAAVVFSGQGQGVVLTDRAGDPLAPALIWMDHRASEQATALMRRLGGATLFEKLVGARITGNYSLAKFTWIRQQRPELYSRMPTFLDTTGYLHQRATGRRAYEWTYASATGVFDLKRKRWDPTLMRLFGLDPAKFPELISPIDNVGGLTPDAAAHLGLRQGTPVFGGGVDAMVAAVGAGAAAVGDAFIILGTSGNLAVLTDTKLKGTRGLATAQSCDPDKLLLIGSNNSTGSCLEWIATGLYAGSASDDEAYARIEADTLSVEPGAGGVLFTPWFEGERSPWPDDNLRTGFYNLHLDHSRAHLVRAVSEGITYNYRTMLDVVTNTYHLRVPHLRITGGPARNAALMQVFADVLDRPVEVPTHPQLGGPRGAALLGAVGLGHFRTVEDAARSVPAHAVFTPNPANRATYDEGLRRYQLIAPAVSNLYASMNRR